MHTLHLPSGNRAHYNSDLSGHVKLQVPNTNISPGRDDLPENFLCDVDIPGEDLLAIAAEYVRNRKIAQLEQAGVDELLGLQEDVDE